MTFIKNLLIITLVLILFILIFRFLFKKETNFTSQFNRKKEFTTSNPNINSLIMDALKKSNFRKIRQVNNSFTSLATPTIWSFAEIITVNVNRISENKIEVLFKSKCLFPLQIFDWGKNERNCNKFFANLSI